MKAFPEAAAVRKAVDRRWITAFADTATARGNVYLAELARFMFETGTRIGEAVLIEPRDLDLGNGRIISRSETTKNGDPRVIHLTKRAVVVLRNLRPRNGRVFGYKTRWSTYGTWKRTCEAADIAYVPPHQAGRHSFATALDQARFTASEIAEAGGWKSTALVQKNYIHPRDAGSRVAAHFDGDRNSAEF